MPDCCGYAGQGVSLLAAWEGQWSYFPLSGGFAAPQLTPSGAADSRFPVPGAENIFLDNAFQKRGNPSKRLHFFLTYFAAKFICCRHGRTHAFTLSGTSLSRKLVVRRVPGWAER